MFLGGVKAPPPPLNAALINVTIIMFCILFMLVNSCSDSFLNRGRKEALCDRTQGIPSTVSC